MLLNPYGGRRQKNIALYCNREMERTVFYFKIYVKITISKNRKEEAFENIYWNWYVRGNERGFGTNTTAVSKKLQKGKFYRKRKFSYDITFFWGNHKG